MVVERIKDKYFLEETINRLKKENPSADIQLLEKTIGALYLVELLKKNNLEFIFKGGTSLVVLLDNIKRFSVDVDIITEESCSKIKDIIEKIIIESEIFTRYEENIRENSASQRMSLEHYKFFFNSVTDNSEKYILLDVAYESNKYARIISKKLENTVLGIKSEEYINLPSIESILGDKLTVLATHTTGISFDSEKELELIKQLYDVDKLFNESENIDDIRQSFINIAKRELQYRKLNELTYKEVLDDIEDFSKVIIFREDMEKLNKITIGVRKFSNFMLEKKFLIDKEALTAASKVLYLVNLIKKDNDSIVEKYNNEMNTESNIPEQYKKRLKVIKKINPEAYFYIIKTFNN